jgi:single-stranded DNA-binding protein
LGKHVPQTADKPKETEPNTMFNKITLIGRLGQNAEAKTAQNNREYIVLNIATQESWKNDKGDYKTRTEGHRVYCLEKSLEVRQDAPERAARPP